MGTGSCANDSADRGHPSSFPRSISWPRICSPSGIGRTDVKLSKPEEKTTSGSCREKSIPGNVPLPLTVIGVARPRLHESTTGQFTWLYICDSYGVEATALNDAARSICVE